MICSRKPLLLLVLTISGCQIFDKTETLSKWDALQAAQSVECSPWPKPPQDLDVTNVSVLTGKSVGFVSEGRTRRGEKVRYFTPFDGNIPIKAERHGAIAAPSGTKFLGALEWNGKFFTLTENRGSKPVLELRQPTSGKLLYMLPYSGPALDQARFLSAAQGFWMAYKAEAQEEQSIEDQPSEIAYITGLGQGSTLVMTRFPGVKFNGKPMLVKTKDPQEILAVWLDTGVASTVEKPAFKVRLLKSDGTASPEHVLKIPLNEEVERWSAFSQGSLGYLAYVDGDTLMGNGSLRIAAFEWEKNLAKVHWVKAKSLMNEHTAEPLWISKGKDAYILLLKWLDGESTLAAYKVSPEDVANLGTFGVFKEGTSLLSTFENPKSRRLTGLIRSRKGPLQEFALCRFGEM